MREECASSKRPGLRLSHHRLDLRLQAGGGDRSVVTVKGGEQAHSLSSRQGTDVRLSIAEFTRPSIGKLVILEHLSEKKGRLKGTRGGELGDRGKPLKILT